MVPNFQNNLFNRSRGKEYITADRLMDWINTVQRDPGLNELLYPKITQIAVEALIVRYEPDEKFRELGMKI